MSLSTWCCRQLLWTRYLILYRAKAIATSNNMKFVHWPLMGGLLHLVQRGRTGRGRSPPRPLLALPNVTAHPSTVSVVYQSPYCCIMVRCSAVLLCPLKGYSELKHVTDGHTDRQTNRRKSCLNSATFTTQRWLKLWCCDLLLTTGIVCLGWYTGL